MKGLESSWRRLGLTFFQKLSQLLNARTIWEQIFLTIPALRDLRPALRDLKSALRGSMSAPYGDPLEASLQGTRREMNSRFSTPMHAGAIVRGRGVCVDLCRPEVWLDSVSDALT